jgi:hypothetical protein
VDPDGAPIYRNAAAKPFSLVALADVLATFPRLRAPAYAAVVRLDPNADPVRTRGPAPGVWDRPATYFVAAPLTAVPFGPAQLLGAMLVIAQ